MPFRLSGIFEPSRPTSSSKHAHVSTNFQTSTVFQVHEVTRPSTSTASAPAATGASYTNAVSPSISPVSSLQQYQPLPSIPILAGPVGPAIITPPPSRRRSRRIDRKTMSSGGHQQSLLPRQMNNVKNVLADYCFALDNKQYDRLGKLFAPNCLAYYNAVAPPGSLGGLGSGPGSLSSRKSNRTSLGSEHESGEGTSGLRGRDAVVAFLRGRVHGKTTLHLLSTQHLDFEFEGGSGTTAGSHGGDGNEECSGAFATACIAKTYFTANTFSVPSKQAPDAPLVHTVQYGQYVDVLRPETDGNGVDGWEIHHRRVIIMVPRLIQPSMLANGSHEDVEQRLLHHQQRNRQRLQRRQSQQSTLSRQSSQSQLQQHHYPSPPQHQADHHEPARLQRQTQHPSQERLHSPTQPQYHYPVLPQQHQPGQYYPSIHKSPDSLSKQLPLHYALQPAEQSHLPPHHNHGEHYPSRSHANAQMANHPTLDSQPSLQQPAATARPLSLQGMSQLSLGRSEHHRQVNASTHQQTQNEYHQAQLHHHVRQQSLPLLQIQTQHLPQ